MQQFHNEALAKQERGLVEIIDWEALKALPDGQFPQALKSSPLSAVPHKSRGWRAILDLSWVLQWEGGEVQSVNDRPNSSFITAPNTRHGNSA